MLRIIVKDVRSLQAPVKWGVLVALVLGSAACLLRFSPAGGTPEPADLLEFETNPNPIGITILVPVLLFLP